MLKPVLTALIVVLCQIAVIAQTKAVPGAEDEWEIENPDRVSDARIETFLGRRALMLRNNTHVIRKSVELIDGTIEFDVAPTDQGHFTAVLFRRDSGQNHENVYMRAHKSGNFDAIQYAPHIKGSATWQIYPEFNTLAELPRNKWTHIKIEIRGTEMKLFVNGSAEPALIVPRLRCDTSKGAVAFWARVNAQPETWAAAISNVSIRPAAPINQAGTSIAAPPRGVLTDWEYSSPLKAHPGPVLSIPKMTEWRALTVEESGLVNMTRAIGRQSERSTAFVRTSIMAESQKTVALDLGFSDEVTVFLNGKPVYSGINAWESRYPGFLAPVKLGDQRIYLDLKTGRNELVLAVSDDQRFGWGLVAAIEDLPTTTISKTGSTQ